MKPRNLFAICGALVLLLIVTSVHLNTRKEMPTHVLPIFSIQSSGLSVTRWSETNGGSAFAAIFLVKIEAGTKPVSFVEGHPAFGFKIKDRFGTVVTSAFHPTPRFVLLRKRDGGFEAAGSDLLIKAGESATFAVIYTFDLDQFEKVIRPNAPFTASIWCITYSTDGGAYVRSDSQMDGDSAWQTNAVMPWH